MLYVAQGEVGHATSSQCEVVVSDQATTCHIIALRSCSYLPLVSLAHVDGACYEDCIRRMVRYHLDFAAVEHRDEKKTEHSSPGKLVVEVHVVGGFEDADGTSRNISTFLISLLDRIAYEESDSIRLVLKTCAISSMNDNGHGCPIGRGLGINCISGDVFLAKVAHQMRGPAVELRSARIWSNSGVKQLSLVHEPFYNSISIDPFHFEPPSCAGTLLSLSDKMLLKLTSTSPEVEEDDFCDGIRSTLRFMSGVRTSDIFGRNLTHPVTFGRIGTNDWKLREVSSAKGQ
uniref:Protein N-terminal asparagine amidohydrolase n=1 Tax=Cyclophora tenuis TaxID=216820 RepID=A0A7S1GRA7_CYCTE